MAGWVVPNAREGRYWHQKVKENPSNFLKASKFLGGNLRKGRHSHPAPQKELTAL